jgi:hypothetical protein
VQLDDLGLLDNDGVGDDLANLGHGYLFFG